MAPRSLMLQSSYVLKDRLYLLRSLAPLKRNLFYITKIRKVFPRQETTQISFKLVTELKQFSVPRKHTNVAAKVIPRVKSPSQPGP